jgi:hypothetical protein
MFKNISKKNILLKKRYKNYKFQYNLKKIKNILLKKKFVLCYFYDFISQPFWNKIHVFIKNHNLKLLKIKKNIFKNICFNSFEVKNIFLNNIIIIFPEQNFELNSNLIQNFAQIKNFHLITVFYKNNFWRTFEIKKIFQISFLKIYVQMFFYFKKNIFFFKQILGIKNSFFSKLSS